MAVAEAADDGEKSALLDRLLKAQNPNVRSPAVTFSFRKDERCYRLLASVEHAATHYSDEGCVMRKDSEECRRLTEDRDRRLKELAAAEEAERSPELASTGASTRILKNQFNFCDRSSMTADPPARDKASLTEPPPIISFCGAATQWEIYDAYLEDIRHTHAPAPSAAAAARSAGGGAKGAPGLGRGRDDRGGAGRGGAALEDEAAAGGDADVLRGDPLLRALRVMERTVCQNACADVTDDYKYWEDMGDAFKDDSGTLLPLWRFTADKARRKAVTALCWHPTYPDLFAAAYGSHDFSRQGGGMIALFSLKNPANPEVTIATDSGALSVDFHPTHGNLLAAGLHDGSVVVYDLKLRPPHKPSYASTVRTGKHSDPVWQVGWLPDPSALSFLSVSADGTAKLWTIARAELAHRTIISLKPTQPLAPTTPAAPPPAGGAAGAGDEESVLVGHVGGTAFASPPGKAGEFIVATEDGGVQRCSAAYEAHVVASFSGHFLAVYSLAWNPVHSDVFLSASADWTVKVWSQASTSPLLSFDLGASVGEAAWAPNSATVFAAVTADGKVHVYDLAENKHEPLCEQQVVHRARLTRVRFNSREPVILVGDDRGTVLCLKLSPNLRKRAVPAEGQTQAQAEVAKLAKIIDAALRDRALMAVHPPPVIGPAGGATPAAGTAAGGRKTIAAAPAG